MKILLLLWLASVLAQFRAPNPEPIDIDSEEKLDENIADSSYQQYSGPLYVALSQNPNDFGRFADGGADENWYIGFDNAWIVKLPPAPADNFSRAFIGAKFGRAKTLAQRGSRGPAVIPGKIYIAISQRPGFSSEQSFFLADTQDVPIEGIGPAQWFWAEVPVPLVSTTRPNYLIIWSPSRDFRDAAHSPILAALQENAAERGGEGRAWNNHSIQGVPPRWENDALQVPITLKPALAIKLVPASLVARVSVSEAAVQRARDAVVVSFSVTGTDIELAWVEFSTDELEWRRVSAYRRAPPYAFTIQKTALAGKGGFLRGAAQDSIGNRAAGGHVRPPAEEARP